MNDEERFAAGMKTRREVLGDPYVDRALAGAGEFGGEMQALITRNAWNDIWNRPGLDRRSRSILVLGITMGLRQWGEFRVHLRGALNNGLSRAEIAEVLLQAAVYAGVPVANHAFKEAAAVFAELDGNKI